MFYSGDEYADTNPELDDYPSTDRFWDEPDWDEYGQYDYPEGEYPEDED